MKAGTPGPWAVCLDTDPMHEEGIVCCGGNELEIRPAAGQLLGDEAADFRLIAAAPDLLAALRVLLRDVEAVDAVADYGLELQGGMDQAHKAIAKATAATT